MVITHFISSNKGFDIFSGWLIAAYLKKKKVIGPPDFGVQR
jgi:hypothetical protein